MLRKMFSYGGPLLLVGAVVFATPGAGQAQHAGGGHFGGAHSGAFHGGGHIGGFHGVGHLGGFHDGYHHGGYHYDYPYSGYGYYPYYGSYSDYPSYNAYESDPTNYGYVGPDHTAPSVNNDPVVQPPVALTALSDTSVRVTVEVPADAQVWIQNTPTTAVGTERDFQSPPLIAGHQYTYTIRARWNANGRAVEQTRQVDVSAGAHVYVDFSAAPATAG